MRELTTSHVFESFLFEQNLNKPDTQRSVATVYIRDRIRISNIDLLCDQAEFLLQFAPVNCVFALNPKQTSFLHIDQCIDLLISVTPYEQSPQLVEVFLLQAILSYGQQAKQAEDSLFFVLLDHLDFKSIHEVFHVAAHHDVMLHRKQLFEIKIVLSFLD